MPDGGTPGAFPPCMACPAPCCSRTSPDGGGIEPPVVFRHEQDAIAKASGQPLEAFTTTEGWHTSLRYVDGHCIFFDSGRCTIYEHRPTDCRLFPLDLMLRADGRVVWIAYQSICPSPYDAAAFRAEVEPLLRDLSEEELILYATANTPLLDGTPFREIE